MTVVCDGADVMSTEIVDRGRGPEIAGTRITVFCVLEWLRDGCTPGQIGTELRLSPAQVNAATEYIKNNADAVEREYQRILERVGQPNPEQAVSLLADSPESLKRRIAGKQLQVPANAEGRE